MPVPDKLEAVKSVTETLSKQSIQPAEEMERLAPNKEHFDSLMNSSQAFKTPSFERVDVKALSTEEIQSIETKPVFAEENVLHKKMDQQQIRRADVKNNSRKKWTTSQR